MSRRTKLPNFIALAAVSVVVSACTYTIKPRVVSLGETTALRPRSTIGPERSELSYRALAVSVGKREIRTLRRMGTTVHLSFDDCAGGSLYLDELYVGETPLNTLRFMTDESFAAFYRPLDDAVVAQAYVPEKLFAQSPDLCAQVQGGSMMGHRLTARRLVFKRAGVAAAGANAS